MSYDVFISYAHKDKKLENQLALALISLKNQSLINVWFDGDIIPGTEWEKQIIERLEKAHIILLLISHDFLASNFCYSIEMKQAIARHEANQARVIPIILRPTDWEGTPFEKLLALPSNSKPITSWSNRDEAIVDILRECLNRKVKPIKERPSMSRGKTGKEEAR